MAKCSTLKLQAGDCDNCYRDVAGSNFVINSNQFALIMCIRALSVIKLSQKHLMNHLTT
jgi:hypothetical protein